MWSCAPKNAEFGDHGRLNVQTGRKLKGKIMISMKLWIIRYILHDSMQHFFKIIMERVLKLFLVPPIIPYCKPYLLYFTSLVSD